MSKSPQDEIRQRRKDLDKELKEPVSLRKLKRPDGGWVKEIRTLLGMNPADLASRLDISRQAVQKLEHSEASGTIAINTLRKAAEALDCEVVYALVPKRTMNKFLQDQAEAAAGDGRGGAKKLAKSLDPAIWRKKSSKK